MGRFDALTQIEEKRETKPPPSPPVVPPTSKPQPNSTSKTQPDMNKKPANPQDRKTANLPPSHDESGKPEKYTTRFLPSWVKKIRLEAIEKDLKDYEVVTKALELYFKSQK